MSLPAKVEYTAFKKRFAPKRVKLTQSLRSGAGDRKSVKLGVVPMSSVIAPFSAEANKLLVAGIFRLLRYVAAEVVEGSIRGSPEPIVEIGAAFAEI
jgi:hypothetical protein